MRRSEAKERVMEVAREMILSLGYADLNVNELAHKAKVSVGTLYYHFPEGKTSILMEIRNQIADHYAKIFDDELRVERLRETRSFNEGLELLLKNLIDIHRRDKVFIAAMEARGLLNLNALSQVAESVPVRELMEADSQPVTRVLKMLHEMHPEGDLHINAEGVKVHKVIDTLIHKFVYMESTFGSEAEFIDMIVKIIRVLLT
jgi:AcrR family transcriptional regulator